jgi:hypothetical protein
MDSRFARPGPGERRIVLSASQASLRRLSGLVPRLSALSGVPTHRLRSRIGFDEACAALAPGADGAPPRIRAIREGRRVVGHEPASDEDVRRIAAAVVARTTVAVALEGHLAGPVGRKAGLRVLRERKWSADPEAQAMAVSALDAVHAAFGLRCLTGPADAAWTSALVVPGTRVVKDPDAPVKSTAFSFFDEDLPDEPGPGAVRQRPAAFDLPDDEIPFGNDDPFNFNVGCSRDALPSETIAEEHLRTLCALVVLRGEAMRTVVLRDLPGAGEVDPDDEAEDASLRRRIGAALAGLDPAAPRPGIAHVATGFDGGAAVMLSVCGITGLGRVLARRLAAAIPFQLQRSERSAVARFRRTLPRDVQDCGGLCRHSFVGTVSVDRFLALREGFDACDNARIVEGFRLMGCVRPHHAEPRLLEAMRRGEGPGAWLEVVLERPVLRRTVRSLMGPWYHGAKTQTDNARDLRTIAAALDAYHASDPHLPVLGPREQAAAMQVCRMVVDAGVLSYEEATDPGILAAALLAHRDASGRIRPPSDGIDDVLRWMTERCRLAFGGRDRSRKAMALHRRQAAAIMFPPQRRREALGRVDEAWHSRVIAMTDEHDRLVASLRPRRATPDYPHLTDRPVVRSGVEITPLLGPDACSREGRELGHCIGTYASQAQHGLCMLAALSSASGRSSAEIQARFVDRHGTGPRRGKASQDAELHVVQHRGVRNGPPPEGHEAALAAWLSEIPQAAMRDAARIARDAPANAYDTDPYAGIGPKGRERLAALARQQLGPFLTGRLKAWGPEEWSAL